MNNSTLSGAPPILLREKPSFFSWISDKHVGFVLPVVAYWAYALFFHVLDTFELAEKYRIHTNAELVRRNKCTLKEVLRAVSIQHVVQTLTGFAFEYFESPDMTGHEAYEIWHISKKLGVSPLVAEFLFYWVFPGFRIFTALLVIDTWQYALHRLMHTSNWLYRNFHSVHHRLYVPYAFGALYNSLIEGFLLDSLGTGVAVTVSGANDRERWFVYTFSTLKTVDDHCGYEFPWDPLQILFPNRSTYHDIHHQQFGIKSNYAQPFFIYWDSILGTRYSETDKYINEERKQRLERYQKHALKEPKNPISSSKVKQD